MEDELGEGQKKDLEKNCGGRGEGRRMDVGSAEEDGPESESDGGVWLGPYAAQGVKRNQSSQVDHFAVFMIGAALLYCIVWYCIVWYNRHGGLVVKASAS